MAALIDADYLRVVFHIHRDVADGRLTPYIAAASRRLLGWVGATHYADSSIADELKLAEGTLAMHLMQLNFNTAVRPGGLVRRETVENNVVVEYLSQPETATSAKAYLDQAEMLVTTWRQQSDLPPVPEIIESDDDCGEAATCLDA